MSYVKIHPAEKSPATQQSRIPKGIPPASAQVAAGENEDKSPNVVLWVRWHDAFDIPAVICTLRMAPNEARELGERLIACANKT